MTRQDKKKIKSTAKMIVRFKKENSLIYDTNDLPSYTETIGTQDNKVDLEFYNAKFLGLHVIIKSDKNRKVFFSFYDLFKTSDKKFIKDIINKVQKALTPPEV